MVNSPKYTDVIEKLIASVVLYLLTFPTIQADYSIGLDSSYMWALNHLFEHDYDALKQLIYPLGPLAFLKNPMTSGINLEIFLVFYTVIKMWFTYMFISIAHRFSEKKPLSYVLTLVMLLLFNVDFLIIGITFIYSFLLLFEPKRKELLSGIAIILASVGLCIKSSLGIISFSIIGMAVLVDFLQHRDYKLALRIIGTGSVAFVATGLLVFHGFESWFEYAFNVLRLSKGYSSALALFPENNWLLLSGFLIAVGCPLVVSRTKEVKYTFLLLLFPLFAMWKHSISRQDHSHMQIMFVFLFLYWGLFLAVSKKDTGKLMLLWAGSLMLYYSNMQSSWNFSPKSIEVNGIVNFEKTILNFDTAKAQFDTLSARNVADNRLNEGLVNSIIGQETVDSYPWELSYFSANPTLNWKPRRTLQSGSFTRWLDEINATDFNRENGPQHLLFHFVDDQYGGKFGSIDDRYLLNDNPRSIHNIFNFYSLKRKTNRFLLLEKNKANNLYEPEVTESASAEWNTWIDVDGKMDGITRFHCTVGKTFFGKVRSFLFKPSEYTIDYLLESDQMLSYRFIPTNAIDGIWVNPFIVSPLDNSFQQVKRIRIRTSNEQLHQRSFSYHFETYGYQEGEERVNFTSYFDEKINPESVLINYFNDFENQYDNTTTASAYTGNRANVAQKLDGYSHTYSILLDTLWAGLDSDINQISLQSSVFFQSVADAKGVYVATVSGSEDDFYNSKKLVFTDSVWKNASHSFDLYRNTHQKGQLKIYIWNNGNSDIYLDNFKVLVTKL